MAVNRRSLSLLDKLAAPTASPGDTKRVIFRDKTPSLVMLSRADGSQLRRSVLLRGSQTPVREVTQCPGQKKITDQ